MTSWMASLTAVFLAAGTPCSAPGAGGVSLSAGSAAEGGAALALVLNLPAYRLDLLEEEERRADAVRAGRRAGTRAFRWTSCCAPRCAIHRFRPEPERR